MTNEVAALLDHLATKRPDPVRIFADEDLVKRLFVVIFAKFALVTARKSFGSMPTIGKK